MKEAGDEFAAGGHLYVAAHSRLLAERSEALADKWETLPSVAS